MITDLYRGDLVRLTAEDPETLARLFSQWSADSEYLRLLDWDPARRFSVKGTQKWLEKNSEDEHCHVFAIRTLIGDQIIGEIGLDGIRWTHGDCFVGIGLGEREFWGKGYGTDAMKIILGYAFGELNLERVTLDVFEYNQRGVRSYEKAGFVHEGRERQLLLREGRRWDVLYMGILRSEWQEQQKRNRERP
ncbi:MAG: GNAT family N-acetyltransferase [Anaerolineales bacterium]|nr:GNAT family N-acetyltransferase [Anaerolineales bacterium]